MTLRCIAVLVLLLLTGRTALAVPPDEQSERKAIAQAVTKSFEEGRFDELEALSNSFSKDAARTSSGVPKIVLFMVALSNQLRQSREADFVRNEQMTEAWFKRYPASPLAVALHADALLSHGYFFRGEGPASSVPPHAWAPFTKYANAAIQFLMDNQAIGKRDAIWYCTLINAARASGWTRSRAMAIADEGVAAFPGDERIYRTVVEYLLPKWGGSAAELDRFIDASTQKLPGTGSQLYARLYINASTAQYERRLFEESQVNWSRMRQGLEDIIVAYPVPWNLNMFAYYACVARDKPKLRELLNTMGNQVVLGRWEPDAARTFEICRNWALAP